jgi:DNA-binding response OmpR family regulator
VNSIGDARVKKAAVEQLKKMSVLFVEDDENSRITIGKFLAARFAKVFLACNGEEGLAEFNRHRPDMVVTDLEMPLMNGMEMIRRIREMGHTIQIVITTGNYNEEYDISLVNRTLIKPIILNTLMDALESCVREQQSWDQ